MDKAKATASLEVLQDGTALIDNLWLHPGADGSVFRCERAGKRGGAVTASFIDTATQQGTGS